MLAGKFYIGYGGETPTTTSITKKGTGFEVKTKTLTNNDNKQSVVWFNFETTVFVNGYYVSLTLPTTGGNARPTNIYAYPIPQGSTTGSAGVVWGAGQDAKVNGEQPPATFDGDYVVGDLKMDWRNGDATAPLTGLSLWFQWDEDVTLANNDQDYVFTINTIKVLPGEGSGGGGDDWEFEAPAGWKDLGEFTVTGDGGTDPTTSNQPGWAVNGHNGLVTDLLLSDLADAKYLVLVGNKDAEDWGYGGIKFGINSNGTSWSVKETDLWGGWFSYHYLEKENVYFVIELANLTGWSDFISGDGTNGYLCLASWPKPSDSIGFKKGFLVNNYPKPEDAVDTEIAGSFLTKTLP
jgi:hypothetical protein